MILQVLIKVFLFCAFGIIDGDLMGFIIAELEVGGIENLIFLDMREHFQRAGAIVGVVITGKERRKFAFQLCAQLIGKIVNIEKICIKRAAVDSTFFANVRNSHIFQILCLQKLHKGFFDFFNGLSPPFVVHSVHCFALHYSNTCRKIGDCFLFLEKVYYKHIKQTSVGFMKGDLNMKKSSFVALLMGTVSGVLFALGMCMALLPEWNAFTEGIIFGAVGLVLGAVTALVWCKMENKKLPKLNGKNVFRVIYAIAATLVLGLGMCLCLVWQQIVWGTLVGLLGIIMLIALIPMIKGIR